MHKGRYHRPSLSSRFEVCGSGLLRVYRVWCLGIFALGLGFGLGLLYGTEDENHYMIWGYVGVTSAFPDLIPY